VIHSDSLLPKQRILFST